MLFSDFPLDRRLLGNLETIRFTEATPIQRSAIPPALDGRDILGSAETGTGKTAAYVLPILQRLLATPWRSGPRALVLVPTRELALQVLEHSEALRGALRIRTEAVYGGVGLGRGRAELRRGVDILVATPGRLLDHLARGDVSFRNLEILVVDEADRMLDIGFLPDLRRIVRALPQERQTLLFSATLDPVAGLAREITRLPVRIEVATATTPAMIDQALLPVAEHGKFDLLRHLLRDSALESVLVFARTKHRADRVARRLRDTEVRVGVIHGDRSQSQRFAALESFRSGRTRVLVATDVAARGIDVTGVSHVVNYDVPRQPEDYVHRIGRTGRARTAGEALTLVTPGDEPMVRQIERTLERTLPRRRVEGFAAPAAPAVAARPGARGNAPWRAPGRRFGSRRRSSWR